ncbi:MAG: DUF4426 domain-containing protein [Candidatus Sedimenticola sp. (ex Thyasira tokunagai)]
MKQWLTAILITLLPALSTLATAENSTRIPGYVIHHNAIPTAILQPNIAAGYGIIRSKYRGLLNISVIREVPGTTGKAVTAYADAQVTNLIGSMQQVKLRKITEGDAIYYIGEFTIVDAETLTFTLEVQPKGSDKTARVVLKQQFFVD